MEFLSKLFPIHFLTRRRNTMENGSDAPRHMPLQLLKEITDGFSNERKLGTGSYGTVYKGEQKNGETIAVKVLNNIPGLDDGPFEKEYLNLASLQHKNVVRLIGYCNETRRKFKPFDGRTVLSEVTKRALCFEYMHNGGLDKYLSDEFSGHDWRQRYAIIKGICQGLKYLHEELQCPMYHLDLKPANVLLDKNMDPKLADFGLSRLCRGGKTEKSTSAIGTLGYIPPEYIHEGIISNKFDVFSLGVVIIKIMTGPTGYCRSYEMSSNEFIDLVHANWMKRPHATSVHLLDSYGGQVKRCLEIALRCVEADRYKRPTIGIILNMLNETETIIRSSIYKRESGDSSAPPGVKGSARAAAAGGTQPTASSTNTAKVDDTFAYDQLAGATSEFAEERIIKHGHSGDLYYGLLQDGTTVVVKRITSRVARKDAYKTELDLFAKGLHERLVPFMGHCFDKEDEKVLVYKFVRNGDLSSSLHGKPGEEEKGMQSLDWIKRLKIATGVAEALCYLHHECNPPMVHRDVQASSILLDDKFEVRLGSLSEVCPQEGESHQNVITKLLRFSSTAGQGSSGSPSATCSYDVYCFGKVLLELVTGRLGISASKDGTTSDWLDNTLIFINIYEKELMSKIIDPLLIIDEDHLEEVWAMAIVAKSCLNPMPSKRPPMKYILKALENPLKVVRKDNGSSSARLSATS